MSELFPKWLFKEDKEFIYIRVNNIGRKIDKQSICLYGMTDVYNSIDYVINFLNLNDFLITYLHILKYNSYNLHVYYNKIFDIYVYIYIDKYSYKIDKTCKSYDCDSEMLLSKLKEILDVESRINPITDY